jgi:hypothetical protein
MWRSALCTCLLRKRSRFRPSYRVPSTSMHRVILLEQRLLRVYCMETAPLADERSGFFIENLSRRLMRSSTYLTLQTRTWPTVTFVCKNMTFCIWALFMYIYKNSKYNLSLTAGWSSSLDLRLKIRGPRFQISEGSRGFCDEHLHLPTSHGCL